MWGLREGFHRYLFSSPYVGGSEHVANFRGGVAELAYFEESIKKLRAVRGVPYRKQDHQRLFIENTHCLSDRRYHKTEREFLGKEKLYCP